MGGSMHRRAVAGLTAAANTALPTATHKSEVRGSQLLGAATLAQGGTPAKHSVSVTEQAFGMP